MSTKRIAKNSFFLYLRMALMMLITLISSRLILENLGVSDFGIFSLVGSLIAFFGAIKGLFASATQRFLNFEMGKGNNSAIGLIFSTSLILHLIIALVFISLVGIVGLYVINNKLTIDPTRLYAAQWVFICSLIITIINIVTIPFDSLVIANEKFNFYATVSVMESILKLFVAYLISFSTGDHLLVYALLLVFVSLFSRFIVVLYCFKKIINFKVRIAFNKHYYKQIGSFAGWQFLGNTVFYLSNEGSNILLNVFFGSPLNAARGIAYQVKSAVMTFTQNITTAADPQLVKLVASDQANKFIILFSILNRTIAYAASIVIFPILFFTSEILHFWLTSVPPYTVIFVRLILVYVLIRLFHGPLDSLFKSIGKIKTYQILDSIILCLNIPVVYLLLKYTDFGPESVFIIMIIIETVNLLALIILAHKTTNLNKSIYFMKILLPIFYVWLASFAMQLLLYKLFSLGLDGRFVIHCISFACLGLLTSYYLGFSKLEKQKIMKYIKSKI